MSEAECETKTADNFRSQLQTMQDSENHGRSKYDQMQVDACLAALRAASCDDADLDPQPVRAFRSATRRSRRRWSPSAARAGRTSSASTASCQKAPMALGRRLRAPARRSARRAPPTTARQNLFCDPRDGNIDDGQRLRRRSRTIGGPCVDGFDCKSRVCVADGRRPAR